MFQLLQGGVAESYHLLKAYRDFCFGGLKNQYTPQPQPLLKKRRAAGAEGCIIF